MCACVSKVAMKHILKPNLKCISMVSGDFFSIYVTMVIPLLTVFQSETDSLLAASCVTINFSPLSVSIYEVCERGETDSSPRGGADAQSQRNGRNVQQHSGPARLVRASQWAHSDPGKASPMHGPIWLYGDQRGHHAREKSNRRSFSFLWSFTAKVCVLIRKQLCLVKISIPWNIDSHSLSSLSSVFIFFQFMCKTVRYVLW